MTASRPELPEKDFINESYQKNPFPLWLWLFLVTAVTAIFWGGANWYSGKLSEVFRESPFLQVTNRQLSLFLWQNPEFMRINAKEKNGYLPAFQYIDKVTIDLPYVDDYALAPPELLFRYHTWHRLVSDEFIDRPIPVSEFRDFLSYVEEWQPAFWPAAPKEYADMVAGLANTKISDLSTLSKQALPMPVRMAFQGWKNYFKEGEDINNVKPTVQQMRKFLDASPNYARNFWRNIVEDHTPDYLKSLISFNEKEDAVVANDQMTSFLKAAVFNFLAAQKKDNLAIER